MRLLLCRSVKCNGLPALLPASRAYPKGEPYIAGQPVSDFRCDRCKFRTQLSPSDYNSLPLLTLEDFKTLGKEYGGNLSSLPTQDLLGNGWSKAQAEDLFKAGLANPMELESLGRLDGDAA